MTALRTPVASQFERVHCYCCGCQDSVPLVIAEEDLTGKPGRFLFVQCQQCELVYQNPRLKLDWISAYYDDEYIAHRKKTDWGPLKPLYEWAMGKHDRDKCTLVGNYVALTSHSKVLDVGCGAGTFLEEIHKRSMATVSGVDFKDLTHLPSFELIDFHLGLFYEQEFAEHRFDLITMWHFLEHDYDPVRTLRHARDLLATDGKLVIEVPRLDSVSYRLFKERWPGLQAPQHTALYSKKTLLAMVEQAGLEVVEYLPYGAFPAYFYLFAGTAFKWLKGRGLNLSKAIYPYFLGQLLLLPVLLFEKKLNLAMQTVICRAPGSR
ncbi:MAG: class I SAM-dependent methyltransferase [Gammaproteobacteria bacterium]|nr:class I SAM-dependent methyltransferase [Gammaproteobacteria bacterium]MDH4313420.1 class I SAM-dependent methyltransferase [Gammaproteobacteria bacterium]MDH5214059.1 class I SAM-dependent methyltransferase [Gammaproteobacteria bacterium]